MKYFLLKTDSIYTTSPNIINWYGKIDKRNIHPQSAYKLPKRELFFIRDNPNTIFTDIISDPFFLVSDIVKDVICMYEKGVIYKEVILLDPKYEKCKRYFLPILPEVECLSKSSRLNLDRSFIHQAVFLQSKIEGHAIFKIAGINSDSYIAGNLEVVESILKRGTVGVGLVEVEVEAEEGESAYDRRREDTRTNKIKRF